MGPGSHYSSGVILSQKLVPIKFKAKWGSYFPNDVAGFEPERAKAFLESDPPIAEPYVAEVKQTGKQTGKGVKCPTELSPGPTF